LKGFPKAGRISIVVQVENQPGKLPHEPGTLIMQGVLIFFEENKDVDYRVDINHLCPNESGLVEGVGR